MQPCLVVCPLLPMSIIDHAEALTVGSVAMTHLPVHVTMQWLLLLPLRDVQSKLYSSHSKLPAQQAYEEGAGLVKLSVRSIAPLRCLSHLTLLVITCHHNDRCSLIHCACIKHVTSLWCYRQGGQFCNKVVTCAQDCTWTFVVLAV